MIKSYTVIVEKRHCENTLFTDIHNCAVCKAMREKYPNIGRLNNNPLGLFINTEWFKVDKPFGADAFYDLLAGEIESRSVTFSREVPDPPVKEIIRYVAVTADIREEVKEMVESN